MTACLLPTVLGVLSSINLLSGGGFGDGGVQAKFHHLCSCFFFGVDLVAAYQLLLLLVTMLLCCYHSCVV